jgi:hypothetical protein
MNGAHQAQCLAPGQHAVNFPAPRPGPVEEVPGGPALLDLACRVLEQIAIQGRPQPGAPSGLPAQPLRDAGACLVHPVAILAALETRSTSRATLPFAAAFAAALAYQLAAPHLPSLGDHDLNAFVSGAGGLAVSSLVVISALPLRDRPAAIFVGLVVGAGAATVLSAAGALEAASPFKAAFAAAAGYGLARFIFSPLIVYALAVGVAAGDAVSVSSGPTRYILDEQPRVVEFVALYLPEWGGPDGSWLGTSDLVFLALYLYCAWRFGLRRRVTAAALCASFIASLAIAVWSDVAVPALPLLSLALLVPNIDRVWTRLRSEFQGLD